MPTVYTHNGKAYLRNGVPVLGDCCCPFREAAIDFWYEIQSPAENPSGATGYHTIYVATNGLNPNVEVQSQSSIWAANWPVDANWTTLECANNICNYAKRNGQAKISLRMAYVGRMITLHFIDNRTFTSPTWSSPLLAKMRISGLKGSTQIRLYDSGGTIIGPRGNGTYQLGSYTKTNTTSVSGTWKIMLA